MEDGDAEKDEKFNMQNLNRRRCGMRPTIGVSNLNHIALDVKQYGGLHEFQNRELFRLQLAIQFLINLRLWPEDFAIEWIKRISMMQCATKILFKPKFEQTFSHVHSILDGIFSIPLHVIHANVNSGTVLRPRARYWHSRSLLFRYFCSNRANTCQRHLLRFYMFSYHQYHLHRWDFSF